MFIEEGLFSIDDMEKMRLHGNYQIKKIKNQACLPTDYHEQENINCQAVFMVGNVLIRTDTEEIEALIDVFIRYTHDPCKDLELDLINETKQMIFGTICPTKKTLFRYKAKVFVAYGRYIFGYDKPFAEFRRENTYPESGSSTVDEENSEASSIDDEDSSSDDEFFTKRDRKICEKITENQIILKNIDYDPNFDEYIYSFCIYDVETGVLDAFGLYR